MNCSFRKYILSYTFIHAFKKYKGVAMTFQMPLFTSSTQQVAVDTGKTGSNRLWMLDNIII